LGMGVTAEMEPIETARMRLDPLSSRHTDDLYRIYSEPAVARFLITRPRSPTHFHEIFQRMLDFGRTLGMWALIHKDGGRLMGRCGFFAFSQQARPEFAILLSQAWWGRGFGTEAGRACLEQAFQNRGWPEVVAVVRPANTRAIRVLLKLGMQTEREIEIESEPAVVYRVDRAAFEQRVANPHARD